MRASTGVRSEPAPASINPQPVEPHVTPLLILIAVIKHGVGQRSKLGVRGPVAAGRMSERTPARISASADPHPPPGQSCDAATGGADVGTRSCGSHPCYTS